MQLFISMAKPVIMMSNYVSSESGFRTFTKDQQMWLRLIKFIILYGSTAAWSTIKTG